MAPLLEEPVAEALEQPLRSKPELVAPEPGQYSRALFLTYQLTDISGQSIAQVLNPNERVKAMPVKDAQIRKFAPLLPKVPILTYLS